VESGTDNKRETFSALGISGMQNPIKTTKLQMSPHQLSNCLCSRYISNYQPSSPLYCHLNNQLLPYPFHCCSFFITLPQRRDTSEARKCPRFEAIPEEDEPIKPRWQKIWGRALPEEALPGSPQQLEAQLGPPTERALISSTVWLRASSSFWTFGPFTWLRWTSRATQGSGWLAWRRRVSKAWAWETSSPHPGQSRTAIPAHATDGKGVRVHTAQEIQRGQGSWKKEEKRNKKRETIRGTAATGALTVFLHIIFLSATPHLPNHLDAPCHLWRDRRNGLPIVLHPCGGADQHLRIKPVYTSLSKQCTPTTEGLQWERAKSNAVGKTGPAQIWR